MVWRRGGQEGGSRLMSCVPAPLPGAGDELQRVKGETPWRPSWPRGTHVGDLAEGAHGRAPVAVFLPGHVLRQAAGTRRRPHAGAGPAPPALPCPPQVTTPVS